MAVGRLNLRRGAARAPGVAPPRNRMGPGPGCSQQVRVTGSHCSTAGPHSTVPPTPKQNRGSYDSQQVRVTGSHCSRPDSQQAGPHANWRRSQHLLLSVLQNCGAAEGPGFRRGRRLYALTSAGEHGLVSRAGAAPARVCAWFARTNTQTHTQTTTRMHTHRFEPHTHTCTTVHAQAHIPGFVCSKWSRRPPLRCSTWRRRRPAGVVGACSSGEQLLVRAARDAGPRCVFHPHSNHPDLAGGWQAGYARRVGWDVGAGDPEP